MHYVYQSLFNYPKGSWVGGNSYMLNNCGSECGYKEVDIEVNTKQ